MGLRRYTAVGEVSLPRGKLFKTGGLIRVSEVTLPNEVSSSSLSELILSRRMSTYAMGQLLKTVIKVGELFRFLETIED